MIGQSGVKLYWWAKANFVGSGAQDTMSDLQMAVFKKRITSQKTILSNAEIHTLCVNILMHTEKHRNCSGASRLLNSLPPSGRRTRIIGWFGKYSPIIIKMNNRIYVAKLAKTGSRHRLDFDLDGAKENPFWKLQI